MVSFSLSIYHTWIASGPVLNVICWVSTLKKSMCWPPREENNSFTTFTCQATVRKNETVSSDVIVPFGLHVWKSFTCGRHVGEHLLCTLVNKGLYGVGRHVHWLQISRIWQLLFMPLMKLVPWIMHHAAHCKIIP